MTSSRELHPRDVLADLLGSEDFPAEIADTGGVADLILQRLRDAGFVVVPDGPDVALFASIEKWLMLWRAEEELPDRDPRAVELRRQAYDLEWSIAALAPSSVEAYRAKRAAIEAFEFDDEDLVEIVFQLGVDAGRLGADDEMPDRTPR